MPGNHDYSENNVSNSHRRHFKISAIFTFLLLALGGGLLGATRSRRAELIENGASRMDQLQTGFFSRNLTVVPRNDPEEKIRCDEVGQRVLSDFVNDQTANTVPLLCFDAMWTKMNEGLSNETPCEVNVAPGTDEKQIAELDALDSICKMLAEKSDSDTGYVMTLCLAALSLLYTVYHGIRVCDEMPFERQPLLEENPRENDSENPDSDSTSSLELSYQNSR